MHNVQVKKVHAVRRALLVLAAVTALLFGAPAIAHAQTAPTQDIPVTGVFDGGTFSGTLDIVRFQRDGGVLEAVGRLSGQLVNDAGVVVGTVTNALVELPVTSLQASCQILHLELGPLDLNLLGLVVHLDRIELDITAQSGPGNLLGNLLCAITNLLNGPGSLTALVQLLNQILGALG